MGAEERIDCAVAATFQPYEATAAGYALIAAVSGGQDSCAMAAALCRWAAVRGVHVHVAHLDHCLRGAESREDALHVARLATRLGVPCTVAARDVSAAARRLHRGTQEVARDIRMRFLHDVADRVGAHAIAVGHTQDDHVETILHNLLRGSGLAGLRGLAPWAGGLVRPMLTVSRADTAAYCDALGLEYRVDGSNAGSAYERNRIRNHLLPLLRSEHNPGIDGALLRLSELARADDDALDAWARAALDDCRGRNDRGGVSLQACALAALPEGVRLRVIRLAAQAAGDPLTDVTLKHTRRVGEIVSEASMGRRGAATWPRTEWRAETADGLITAAPRRSPCSATPVAYDAPIPGSVVCPGLGIEADLALCVERTGDGLFLPIAALRPPIVIRNRRPGDRLRLRGVGTRKLQDIMVDRKVPREQRDRLPVVCDAEGPLAVPGIATDDRALQDPAGGAWLRIRIAPLA
jgi:tRNA(Ile)-lysidine synthase